MPECATCADPRLDDIEADCVRVLDGEPGFSWNSMSAKYGRTRQSLRVHMENHFVRPLTPTQEAMSGVDEAIAQTIVELTDQMRQATPEVKPLYAVAIANLKNLDQTKPSQQHLISALKAITEITGMKMEQRFMLGFAQAMFRIGPAEAQAALPQPEVIELDSVEVTVDR